MPDIRVSVMGDLRMPMKTPTPIKIPPLAQRKNTLIIIRLLDSGRPLIYGAPVLLTGKTRAFIFFYNYTIRRRP